ncbi:RNA polymerase sigma-54 factor RpoN [Lachnospiraceae bacterium TWA4]|nr:RNA polymerase sigma-54 factor RpoN [Lachnospiraceae bacterium TWA4]
MTRDEEIIELFWNRNEQAIEELQQTYGKELFGISYRILNNRLDSEECVNDTYLSTWNSIPHTRPKFLFAYIGKIVRNLSIDHLKKLKSKKREVDNLAILLSELEDCISTKNSITEELEYKELAKDISIFLRKQKEEYRVYFIERYWYAKSVREIAKEYEVSEKKVESILYRCRKKLQQFLTERGYIL